MGVQNSQIVLGLEMFLVLVLTKNRNYVIDQSMAVRLVLTQESAY